MRADAQRVASMIPEVAPESMLCTSNVGVDAKGCPRVEIMTGVHLQSDIHRVPVILSSFFAKFCPFGVSLQHCIEV